MQTGEDEASNKQTTERLKDTQGVEKNEETISVERTSVCE